MSQNPKEKAREQNNRLIELVVDEYDLVKRGTLIADTKSKNVIYIFYGSVTI